MGTSNPLGMVQGFQGSRLSATWKVLLDDIMKLYVIVPQYSIPQHAVR